jgi:peptidoglycan/LPS O-acetylase OafA/YrhL
MDNLTPHQQMRADQEQKVGTAVHRQATDNSLMNTDPLVAKAAVIGVATSVLIALGAFGLVSEEQRTVIIEQVGNITYGVFVVLPIIVSLVTAAWARLSVYSPRSAARIAVANASAPAGAVPALDPPP